ncbi:unnamed protein product [Spirodela intermedia]|uniref:RING-type E3 ubiquitin transferase n=1 Tax=Spirodela intermedia TaxID=51605 RepID=A0A7I8IMB7_SPIIN|nr:unnamed protein product [Spirodela intermedia]CAA6658680.1 unnamed protein product [Spirodela intermedia]
MSSRDQTAAAILASVAMACDGALVGVALAFVAAQTWAKYHRSSAALGKIRRAPSARVADLREILLSSDEESSSSGSPSMSSGDARLVVVRGEVQTRWSPGSKNSGALVSQGSGERAVIVQRTSTCLYSEWRGIFGWSIDLHALFAKTWKEQHSSSLRTVPFVLVDDGYWPHREYVNVTLEGSTHPLPLTTVYHQLLPVQATTYTFIQAMFGHGYPVALLDEEKILPVGKEITAVGLCSWNGGVLEMKSSDDLPCFLSDLSKSEMEADLTLNVNILLWSGIFLGVLSMGILGYAVRRIGGAEGGSAASRARVRGGAQRRRGRGIGEVPDGALCVICLTRQRRCAFIPCGHRVCCFPCAAAVKRDSSPSAPSADKTPQFCKDLRLLTSDPPPSPHHNTYRCK